MSSSLNVQIEGGRAFRLGSLGALLVLLLAAVAASSAAATPHFQPSSIAFLDQRHGVLAEDDWSCGRARGCRAQILVSGDGGMTWRISYHGTMPIRVYAVRGTRTVWASTGRSVIVSRDGGVRWRRARARPAAAIGFATPADGWLLEAGGTFDRPAQLLSTRDAGATWTRVASPCRGVWGRTVAVTRATARRGWLACVTEMSTGTEGKEVWSTADGGATWQLRARTKFPGLPAPSRLRNRGDLPSYGYVTGIGFLADGHGWLWEDRGWLLMTRDGGSHWQKSPITQADQVAAQSASVLDEVTGYVLLRGCTVRLVRTSDGGKSWRLVRRWGSPTTC
jgi:photosystem II stability/assembly factor-like uncharacterized protein